MSLDHYTVKDAPEGHELHHPHELSVCKVGDDDDGEQVLKCGLCEKDVVDRKRSGDVVYVCKSCDGGYLLHKSCGDLPLQINHSFHLSHGPLKLIPYSSGRWCFSCSEYKNFLYYECNECEFHMDSECALMMPTRGEEESIQHITHPHPLLLLLLHADADEDMYCKLCESKISGGDNAYYYGCTHCNYFLHKSCAHFPHQFSPHPLHPHHSSLSVSYTDYRYFTCNICERDIFTWRFHFKCDDHQCSFRMCWKCIITVGKRSIKYEDHGHLLCYVDNHKHFNHCNAYDAYCTRPDLININIGDSMEFKRTASSVFKCFDCDCRLHFLCGPLPSTINHHSHIHSLTLLDSLVEDDFGEYYCDVCETRRDPRIRIYHCSDCKYFAHVHCVISEIVKVVRGDVEGVELNALGNDCWRRRPTELETTSFTLMDLIHQIPDEYEKKVLKLYYKWDVGIVPPKQREAAILNDDKELYKILQLSRFDDTHFHTLIKEFHESIFTYNEKLELRSSDLGMKMVKVKGYMIPYPLAGVLQTLLDQYGDIAIDSESSLEMKSFVYFILCHMVKRMRATLVKDVTKHFLQEWFFHLRFLSYRDIKIGFARVQFERLVDGYLGFQAKMLKDEIPNLLKMKIVELQQGLEKCKEYQGSTEKSEYMKYCLEKASDSKMWNYAFDPSFKDHVETLPIPRQQWSRW